MGRYYNARGEIVEAPDDYARGQGYQPVSPEDEAALYAERGAAQFRKDEALGPVETAGVRFLGGATLGATDVALAGATGASGRQAMAAGEEEHPYIAGGAELAGTLAGAFAAPGSALGRTPAGYLARGAGAAFERGAERGGVAGTLEALASAGAEGAVQNAGSYIGHAAIEDKELTAEGLGGALRGGFEFGALGGGAALGIEKGTIAARRMFSRVMDGGKNAVLDAETAWSKASSDALSADEQTLKAAKDELENLRAARREAEVEKMRSDVTMATEKERAARMAAEGTAVPVKGANGSVMSETAGPAGETQVAQTSSAIPENQRIYDEAVRNTPQGPTKVSKAPELPPASPDVTPVAAEQVTKVSRSTPLEKKLTEMRARAAGGESLPEMAAKEAPAVATGDTANRLATAERNRAAMQNIDQAFGFKNPLGKDFAKREAELSAAINELEASITKLPDVNVQVTPEGFGVMGRGPEVGSGGVPMEFGRAEVAPATRAGKKGALEKLDAAHEAALERAAAATDDAGREAALAEARSVERDIAAAGVEGNHAVASVARDAENITRYEKASRKLAEVVGDNAHPATVERGKALTDAEDDAVRKVQDRTTRAVEDHEIFGPAKLSTKERLAQAKAYKQSAAADLERAKLAERGAKDRYEALPKPEKSMPDKKGGRPSKRERLEALGGAYEMADIPGLPKIHDLPVVGPLLATWVKFKAIKGALARATGRVPATADARAAAVAARVRDKVAESVDRALGLAEKVAVKGRQPMIVLSAVAARRIFDDGEPGAKKGARTPELVATRIRELSAYVASDAIERDVRAQMRDVVDPDLIAAAEAHQRAVYQHLLDTAPKGPPPDPLNRREWAPSPTEALKWARRLAVAQNPVSVFDSLGDGTLTVEQVETLRECYPRLYGLAQQRVLERSADLKGPLDHRSRVMMSILFDAPLDSALAPENLNIVQSVYLPSPAPAPAPGPGAPPVPSVAADVNLTQLYQAATDRSVGMR